MTKITIGKGTPRPSMGQGARAGGSGMPKASGFDRAINAGKSKASGSAGVERSAGSASAAPAAQPTETSSPSKVYETMKIVPAHELVGDFRTLKSETSEVLAKMPADQAPSVAIVQRSGGDAGSGGGNPMQQIGGTIFVDHQLYADWKSGSDASAFESGLHQMIEARSNSSH